MPFDCLAQAVLFIHAVVYLLNDVKVASCCLDLSHADGIMTRAFDMSRTGVTMGGASAHWNSLCMTRAMALAGSTKHRLSAKPLPCLAATV